MEPVQSATHLQIRVLFALRLGEVVTHEVLDLSDILLALLLLSRGGEQFTAGGRSDRLGEEIVVQNLFQLVLLLLDLLQ